MPLRWVAGWFCSWLVLGAALGAAYQTGLWRRSPAVPVISVWRPDGGGVMVMDVERYVVGVVAAEMPALFHPEALKAQAVAARTYALRALHTGRRVPHHPDAVVTASVLDQDWASPAMMRERWGSDEAFRVYWARIEEAVRATRGQILTYGGEPIEALYHASSGGRTESADAYFSTYRPYLISVPDPFGCPASCGAETVRMPWRDVAARLGLPGSPGKAVAVAERTPSGRARTVRIGEAELAARDVRERLGLPSTWFDVHVDGDDVVWTVRGSGHGVGMSQYGADGMARRGLGYDAILRHYYPGSRLETVY